MSRLLHRRYKYRIYRENEISDLKLTKSIVKLIWTQKLLNKLRRERGITNLIIN